jgi:membrane protein
MARLSDVSLVIRRLGFLPFLRRVWDEMAEDHLLAWASSLAYSWLLAIFPFLIFLLTLIPYLPDPVIAEAKTQIPTMLKQWLPDNAADTLWKNIENVLTRPRTGLLSIGLVVTIWAASGGMNMTMTALDKCYEVEKGRRFYTKRPTAIALTICAASLILLVLLLIPIGNVATRWSIKYLHDMKGKSLEPGLIWVWYAARYVLALVLMTFIVQLIYFFGTSIKQKWRAITPGAVFCIAVWLALGLVFRWYVNTVAKDKYDQTYGTVGGVAVLLLFFYLDALVLLIGAEINSEIDFEVLGVARGSRDFTIKPEPMFPEASQPVAAS